MLKSVGGLDYLRCMQHTSSVMIMGPMDQLMKLSPASSLPMQAIAESDPFYMHYKNRSEAKDHGRVIATQMGCPAQPCSEEFFHDLVREALGCTSNGHA
jgi:hypothetical protein